MKTLLYVSILSLLTAHCGSHSAVSDAHAEAALFDQQDVVTRDAIDGSINDTHDASDSVDASTDAPDVFRPRRVSLSFAGNLLIEPRVTAQAMEHRDRGRLGWVLSRVGPMFSPHDIAYADLETPLNAQSNTPGHARFNALGAPVGFARDLAHLGFDVLSVATNHAYDQGGDALQETLDALREAGVTAVGAGTSDDIAYGASVVERDGVRVAFLGFTLRTNDGPGQNTRHLRIARLEHPAQALAAIRAARSIADLVVVGVHWSRDNEIVINDTQRTLARRMIEAGADVVAGAGPYVLQRVERSQSTRGDALVAYSLGNLVSNSAERYRVGQRRVPGRDPATRDGVVLRATFEIAEQGTVHLVSLTGVALWTINTDEEIREVPLRAADEEVRDERLPIIRAAVGNLVRIRP